MSKPDNPAEVQFLHAAMRAESEWLLARETDPSAPAPSPEIAADYAELEALLGSLPSGWAGERWQEEVLRAASALPSRPWWRTPVFKWVTTGALATAASVVVWTLLPRTPDLEVGFRYTATTRGTPGEHVIGDHLVITAHPREAGDLRVYRSDGALVGRCPHGPGCKAGARGAQTIDITLDAPVQYQVILVDGVSNTPPDGPIDVYLAAARAANARITIYKPIDVH